MLVAVPCVNGLERGVLYLAQHLLTTQYCNYFATMKNECFSLAIGMKIEDGDTAMSQALQASSALTRHLFPLHRTSIQSQRQTFST